MGIVHREATVSPTKLELVETWLRGRAWASGRRVTAKVAEYRFDDPEGEVGVETILWSLDDGSVVQVPFTYRAAPLPGADGHLVDTMDHSVLGKRWIYDGCADPVWAATLATAIARQGTQAQMWFERDGQRIDIPARMHVRGTGLDADVDVTRLDDVTSDGPVTTTRSGGVTLRIAHVVGTPLAGDAVLTGRVGDDGEQLVLAALDLG